MKKEDVLTAALPGKSVLERMRNGEPLYEIAGSMGISTHHASEMMEAELIKEAKKQLTFQTRYYLESNR